MLELTGVTVTYDGVPAVDDVDLTLDEGRVLAVLGPSGCGKSTLLRAVAGLERLAAGRIVADGRDLARVPTHRRGFALMFQDGQLFEHRSVAENVAYALRLRRRPEAAVATRVEELLTLVGLPAYGGRAPATLSGGERQRVALARALATEPRLLLLDEPLSALDRSLREHLAAELREILVAAGTTAVLVTHDHEEAFAVADELAVMRGGRLLQHGAPDDVWRHPVDGDVARFLGYATVLEGAAAQSVHDALGPGSSGAVALRRSALRVAAQGPLSAEVLGVRATPDLTRVRVRVEGVGELDAVADPADPPAPGQRVRLVVDVSRLALLDLDSPP